MKRTIAENGNACYGIAFDPAKQQSAYAARELRYYLGMITGAAFDDTDDFTGPCIRLNQQEDPSLGAEGFRLESDDAGLTITGGVRGILYGTYELLERLGCRFFTPKDEKIPYDPAAVLPELHEERKPVLEYRLHDTNDFTACPRFAVKQRINGVKLEPRFGGGLTYVWFVHTMDSLIPQAEFAKTHPEYFAMRDGKRFLPADANHGQRCLTNPDVLEISIARVRAALKEHPECRLISVSQLDNTNFCTCPACAKVDAEEGSSAGTMLRFVNAVAARLKPEFPDVVFDTLSYMHTRPTPSHVKPDDNVCVRLCSIECCFSHPFETCDDTTRGVLRPDGTRTGFVSDLQNWSRICNRLYVWDYTTCFSHYPTPHPNWHCLQPNLQLMVKNNVRGVFEQANSKIGGGPDLVELRQYLIAKLLWDPDCDMERHMTEFLEYYYGKAAPMVREYLEAVCTKCEQDDIHVGFNDPPTGEFVSEEMLDRYEEILSRAEEAVRNVDPLHWMRVKRIQFCPRYLRLKRDSMLHGKQDPEALNRFFTEWRAYGFTRLHEWASAETAHQAFLRKKWRGEELLPFGTEDL